MLRQWLKEERGRQTRLADQINVNSGYLSEVASGKKVGSLALFRSIAEATGLSFAALASGVEPDSAQALQPQGMNEPPAGQITPTRPSDRMKYALSAVFPQISHLSHYTVDTAHHGFAIAAGDLLVVEAKFETETIDLGQIVLARKIDGTSAVTILGRVALPWLVDHSGVPSGRLGEDTSVIGILRGVIRGAMVQS